MKRDNEHIARGNKKPSEKNVTSGKVDMSKRYVSSEHEKLKKPLEHH
jgi:hypothetical protein